jgi:hypothetical protein
LAGFKVCEVKHLFAITLCELQAGVELTRTKNATKAQEIEWWIDRLAGVYEVLQWTLVVFVNGAVDAQQIRRG